MYGHLDLDVTGRGAAERPDCAFGEAEAQSLASASANAEGLSTSMTSTMREGNQRAGHLASYDASNMTMPERREDGSYTVPIRILRIHMEEDAAKMVRGRCRGPHYRRRRVARRLQPLRHAFD